MPIKFEIFPEDELVITIFTGVVNDEMCFEYLSSLSAKPGFDPSFKHLSDMSGVIENHITREGVKEMAARSPFSNDSLRAFIFAESKSGTQSTFYKSLKDAKSNNILVTYDRKKPMIGCFRR